MESAKTVGDSIAADVGMKSIPSFRAPNLTGVMLLAPIELEDIEGDGMFEDAAACAWLESADSEEKDDGGDGNGDDAGGAVTFSGIRLEMIITRRVDERCRDDGVVDVGVQRSIFVRRSIRPYSSYSE